MSAASCKTLRRKWLKEGGCTQCGQAREVGKLCRDCRTKAREYQRQTLGYRPWYPGGPGRPPLDQP